MWMKKEIRILGFALILSIFFISTGTNPVKAGPACESIGGACVNLPCPPTTRDWGKKDCGGILETCCVNVFQNDNPSPIPEVNVPVPNDSKSNILCDNEKGISTAIGCIPVLGSGGMNDFLAFILRWATGIGSGIAFVLMLYSGFMIMTSQGNPERMQAGRELLTSAISGLLLIIFSIFILKFIGIDILGLCKFGFGICPP